MTDADALEPELGRAIVFQLKHREETDSGPIISRLVAPSTLRLGLPRKPCGEAASLDIPAPSGERTRPIGALPLFTLAQNLDPAFMMFPSFPFLVFPTKDASQDDRRRPDCSSRYVPQRPRPSTITQLDQYSRRDRQPTQEPEDHGLSLNSKACLELRFSHGPQTRHGIVLGSDPFSDIVLLNLPGISFHHLAITFDQQNRPVVQDLGSLHGTEVTYDNEGKGVRSNFVWIVGGDAVPMEKESIVIKIHKDFKFLMVVYHHEIASQQYIDNINRFRQGTTDADHLVDRLDLRSRPQTERASGAHTPGSDPIHLRKKVGREAFGVVTRCWDVSTGDEYALKEPSWKAIRENKIDINAWKKEARIMGLISHDHIVQLFGVHYNPWPQLRLKYMPGGSPENQCNISIDECVRILCQCLSALTYLHESKGIVHRDIKPGNILVKYLDTGNIYKFADFGLSKESRDPETICGSPQYLAPELFKEWSGRRAGRTKKRTYTSAVDIWSLGEVVFECAYDLPRSKAKEILWCEEIVRKLNNDLKETPDHLKLFLSTTMIIIDPDLRCSAKDCYDQARRLADLINDCSQTPTLASYALDYQQVIYLNTTSLASDLNGPSPSLNDYSIASTEIQRYIRSNFPPPDSHVSTSTTTGKRATRVSKSSSSSRRHQVKSRRKTAPSSDRGYQKESESDAGYFHENWLRDPLRVGSSVAALGQEMSNWSSLTVQSPGRYDQRTLQEPLNEEKNKVSSLLLQDWPGEPNRAELSQWNLPPIISKGQEHGYGHGSAFGDGKVSARNTYLADPLQGSGENGRIAEGAWYDSEAHLAATLLQGMRQAA